MRFKRREEKVFKTFIRNGRLVELRKVEGLRNIIIREEF
jgi:hypothetical protein